MKKETRAQVFSCAFCEICIFLQNTSNRVLLSFLFCEYWKCFQNIIFTEHNPATDFVRYGCKGFLNCAPCTSLRLHALRIIDTHFMHLRTFLSTFTVINKHLMRVFSVLYCVVTIEMQAYKAVLHDFFLSFILRHWLHCYFYNYLDQHVHIFCSVFLLK